MLEGLPKEKKAEVAESLVIAVAALAVACVMASLALGFLFGPAWGFALMALASLAAAGAMLARARRAAGIKPRK